MILEDIMIMVTILTEKRRQAMKNCIYLQRVMLLIERLQRVILLTIHCPLFTLRCLDLNIQYVLNYYCKYAIMFTSTARSICSWVSSFL